MRYMPLINTYLLILLLGQIKAKTVRYFSKLKVEVETAELLAY